MNRVLLIAASCVATSAFVLAQGSGGSAPAEMTTPSIPGVVTEGTKVQVIATWDPAFGGEGPIAAPDGSVLFAHQDLNKIIRISVDDKLSTYVENTNRTAGLAYDARGRLIGVGSDPAAFVVLAPIRSVIADSFEGQPFVMLSDIVADTKGGAYITHRPFKETDPPPPGRRSAILYLRPDGRLVNAAEGVSHPNGIQLSPDGKVVYVANSSGEYIVAYDVQPDGRLANQRNFVKLQIPPTEPAGRSGADGLAIDSVGRLYVAGFIGVQVYSPEGKHLGTIPTPQKPANLAFGGPDRRTLYVVRRGAAYKIRMLAEGLKNRAK